jgi:hypothetical protein
MPSDSNRHLHSGDGAAQFSFGGWWSTRLLKIFVARKGTKI